MSAFQCVNCRKIEPNRYRQYRLRREFVRLDGKKRDGIKTQGLWCLDCIEALVLDESGAGEQQALKL